MDVGGECVGLGERRTKKEWGVVHSGSWYTLQIKRTNEKRRSDLMPEILLSVESIKQVTT